MRQKSITEVVFFRNSCTLIQLMKYMPEVKRDLLKVITIIVIFGAALTLLKMYDAKTNEIAKIGNTLLSRYVK